MLRPLIKVILVLCLGPGPMLWAQNARVLTNCVDVLRLPAEKAREGLTVRVRGVLTCYVPGSQLCFVQDETAGIYVQPAPWPRDLEIGQVVTVEGTSAEGRFSPIIQWAAIRPTGNKKTIVPRRVTIEELNTGRMDCQYVELEGVAQSAQREGNVINVKLALGSNVATILIFSLENARTNIVDARVRVRGVAGSFYSGEQLTGFGLFLQNASFMEVVRPAPAAFSQPIRSAARLAWYSPEGAIDHRAHVAGTVTLAWPGDSFFLEDASGAVRVVPSNPANLPEAGDVVNAIGFIRNPTGPNPALIHSEWKKAGKAELPAPLTTTIQQLWNLAPKGQRVAVEGTLSAILTNGATISYLLSDQSQSIRALSPQALSTNLLGCNLRLAGTYATVPSIGSNIRGAALLVGSTNDLTVIRAGVEVVPLQKSQVALAAAVAAAMLFGAFAWILRKSAKQIEGHAQLNASLLEQRDKEIAELRGGRERLGRDLHDHIIQSIYAIGLSVEDCRQSVSDTGRTEGRLKTAQHQLNEVIRQLRNVISGLESNMIEPKEFRTALKSLALTLGDDKSNRIRLELEQSAVDALNPMQATELVHIAREAMSNSIRHGHAQMTTVRLHPREDQLRFVVEDDGRGFDPKLTDTNGYGLRNMAKRAEDLGAKFTVEAQKGVGTRIVLDIPKQKQHFSPSEPRSRIDR